MNQILSTENNYKRNKQKNSEVLDMRKLLIIFSVIIIIFALVIVIAKIYGFVKNKNNPSIALNQPTINITEAQNACRIAVSYDEGLDKITYWWNDGENVRNINMNGSKDFSSVIEIPEGNYNVIYVKATGIDGSSSESKKAFQVGETVDPNKPQISWFFQDGKIEIVARSEKGIKNLTYQWEDEEQFNINSTEENQKELRITINAKRGTSKITITATDLDGNTQVKSDQIIGIIAPEIKFWIENNNLLRISVKHDSGFKKVIIKINDQEMIYDENNPQYSSQTTDLNIDIALPAGSINLEITVYTLEAPEKSYVDGGHATIQ